MMLRLQLLLELLLLLVQHHDVAVGQLEVLIVAAADTRHVADFSFLSNPCRERQNLERELCVC